MSADPSEGRERARYVKKAIPIDVIQFNVGVESHDAVVAFLGMENWKAGNWWINPLNGQVGIVTLEGTMIANLGDWIAKGVKGEFYPIRKDIFEETYELESKSGRSLEQERDELRAQLLKHGRHAMFCTVHVRVGNDPFICNCGWEEVKAKLAPPVHKGDS